MLSEKQIQMMLRGLSAATGFGALRRAYRGVGWAARGGLEIVQWMKDFTAGGERTWPEIPDHRETSAARFSWLAAAQGLDDADILAMRQRAKTWFTVWFLALGALVCWAMLAPRLGMLGHSFIPALDYALPWIVVFPVLAKVVQWSYWSMQLRRRELLPFQTWLHSPGEWMAAVDDKVLGAVALFLLTGTAVATFLFPSAALAQAASGTQQGGNLVSQMFGAIGQNELSTQWLQRLFPGAMPNSGVSAAQDVVGQIFGTLNSVFAAMAAAMLGWHTVSGTVATAHEGKVLGQRWHTIWAPIRVVMGMGSIVPVKGYCMAQLLMLQIIMAGYNLADVVWNQYVDLVIAPPSGAQSAFGGQAAMVISPESTAHQGTLNALLDAEICYQTAAWNSPSAGSNAPSEPASLQRLQAMTNSTGGRPNYNYPAPGGDGSSGTSTVWDYGTACRKITISNSWSSGNSSTPANGVASAANAVASWTSTWNTNASAFQAFDQAKIRAFSTLVTSVRASNFAQDAVKKYTPAFTSVPDLASDYTQTQSAFSTYKAAIASAAGTLSPALNTTARQEFATNAKTLGWAVAGVLEPQIIRANAAVVDLASEQPDISSGTTTSEMSDWQIKILNQASRDASQTMGRVTLADPNASTGDISAITAGELATTAPTAIYSRVTRWWSNRFNSILNSSVLKLDVADPMSSIQTEGNMVLGAVEAIDTGLAGWIIGVGITKAAAMMANQNIVTGALTLGAATVPGSIAAGVGDLLVYICGLWNQLSLYLLAFGAVEAIILPLMGYSMWFFALVGLITLNVEMVVGATWWAFSHVRMDGQELIDQPQRQGYVLAWNAMFRPTLMLLGLIFGNVIISVSAALVNQTYVMATTSAQGGHFLNPVAFIASFGFLTYMHYHMVTRSFGLITQLPDRVARWVGAGGENLGEESDHKAMTGGASNIIYTGAGQGGSGGRSMVQQAGSRAQKGKEAAEAAEDAKWSKRLGGAGGAGGKVENSGATEGADKPNDGSDK